MKLKSTLITTILMIFVASTATSFAAEEQPNNGKAETTKAENIETKKPVKKHSHMTEKTGIPAEAAQSKSHRETMDKDMPMHDHAKERR